MIDVIVAGAGPVGMSVAAALVTEGLRPVVLEAAAAPSEEARASTLHPPTLEMFARWGALEEVLAHGRRVDRLQFWDRSTRALVAELPYQLIGADTRFPFRLQCPQNIVTRALARRVEPVRWEHEVVGHCDRGDHVEVLVRGRPSMRARYLVGADGARSTVRRSLGLGFEGATYADRFLLVSTDLDLSARFPGMGPVAYVFDPDEWVIVMHLAGSVRVVFRLGPREPESFSEEEARARVVGFVGKGLDFQVLGVSVYSVHQRVADRFRVGRVLLAGDAAHINNPAGGMGMNSGIHDAEHLARALARAVRASDESELDRYAEERRAVAVESVQRCSDKNYRDLVARDPEARRKRDQELRETARDPERARAYLLRASMLEERA
jgi:3-(3-hydroxy-phenyl)propionate hydroxylase